MPPTLAPDPRRYEVDGGAEIEARSIDVADSGMFLDTAGMIGLSVYNRMTAGAGGQSGPMPAAIRRVCEQIRSDSPAASA